MITQTENHLITSLITPALIKAEFPVTSKISQNIQYTREMVKNIILGRDKRLLVVVGPCSIHDSNSALEYATLLKKASERYSDDLCIIMRTYFEKPRTTIGWKGLLNDPHLNGSYDINSGLKQARKLLLDINDLGVAAATEFLNTLTPHYYSDLIAWAAIGARTSESQIHRELASGLSMPVGFKNNTYGHVQPAVDAVNVAQLSHSILEISQEGSPIIFKTNGNPHCHIVLRGAYAHTNFNSSSVQEAVDSLRQLNLNPHLMIDCSHGNTGKNFQLQQLVVDSICQQIKEGSNNIFGVMIESHLIAGKQLPSNQPLIYGQSITDGCLSWEQTAPLIDQLATHCKSKFY